MVADFMVHFVVVNFCLQQWKNYKNQTAFAKVVLKWKSDQFFDSQCTSNLVLYRVVVCIRFIIACIE